MLAAERYNPDDRMLGGYSSLDGTIEFYGRVTAILEPHFKVLDLGAGRGAWHSEDKSPFRRSLHDIRSKVTTYIGADVDEAVLNNPSTTQNVVIHDGVVPLGNGEFDLIICDYVLEHVVDVDRFKNEVSRLLKQGGVLCGRTPHALNYVSIAARFVKNARHAKYLRYIQPNRQAQDVFPTAYKCNTLSRLRTLFSGWDNFSYIYTSEPQYYFGRKSIYRIFSILHKLAPAPFTGNLFFFLRKSA